MQAIAQQIAREIAATTDHNDRAKLLEALSLIDSEVFDEAIAKISEALPTA